MKLKIIIPLMVLFCMSLVFAAPSVERVLPATVNPGGSFTVKYSVSGTSGSWGASVEDQVTGGCTFPDGSSSYKTVMLSVDGLTKTITMQAPSSGTCSFTGDYQFGTDAITSMSSGSVSVQEGGSCTPQTCSEIGAECGSQSDNCGGTITCGTCSTGTVCQEGNCIDTALATTNTGSNPLSDLLGNGACRLWEREGPGGCELNLLVVVALGAIMFLVGALIFKK